MSEAFSMPLLGYQKNQFILHNASPETIDVQWAARRFTLPAVDKIGPNPAFYDTGEPIPGTLVLEDGYVFDKEGNIPDRNSPPNWSAHNAIRNVLGIDPVTKTAVGTYARAGLSFLPAKPSKDLVALVRADGEKRWQDFMVTWADETVNGYQRAIEKAKQAGAASPPPTSDYTKACMILERRKKEIEAQWDKAPQVDSSDEDEELEIMAVVKAQALALAAKAAAKTGVDKEQLAEELLKDPELLASLRRKGYRIRKKGHLDVPLPDEQE